MSKESESENEGERKINYIDVKTTKKMLYLLFVIFDCIVY